MRVTGWAALSAAILIVAACATPYQERGFTGGWDEKRINDSAWLVSFSGNGHTSKDRVWYFWINRCAELTLKSGYRYFVIRPVEDKKTAENSAVVVDAAYRPQGPAHLIKVRSGGSVPVFIYGGGGTITTYSSHGVVLMFKQPLPMPVPWAIDAQAIIDALAGYIKGDGDPPSRTEMFERAFVAHSKLSFEVLEEAVSTSAASAAPSPGKARAVADIQAQFSNLRLPFYQAFQEHMSRAADAVPGRIVLAFDVSANGIVSNARMLSSSYADAVFNDAVLTRLKQMEFGAADVADTQVSQLAITFAPKPD